MKKLRCRGNPRGCVEVGRNRGGLEPGRCKKEGVIPSSFDRARCDTKQPALGQEAEATGRERRRERPRVTFTVLTRLCTQENRNRKRHQIGHGYVRIVCLWYKKEQWLGLQFQVRAGYNLWLQSSLHWEHSRSQRKWRTRTHATEEPRLSELNCYGHSTQSPLKKKKKKKKEHNEALDKRNPR